MFALLASFCLSLASGEDRSGGDSKTACERCACGGGCCLDNAELPQGDMPLTASLAWTLGEELRFLSYRGVQESPFSKLQAMTNRLPVTTDLAFSSRPPFFLFCCSLLI